MKNCDTCNTINNANNQYCDCCLNKFNEHNHLELSFIWLLTGVIFYIPANIMPIMKTEFFLELVESNIIDGIISLWQSGSYLIAGIIFFASIFIPISKFIILLFLLFYSSSFFDKYRIKFYKLLKKLGRWSMIDIIVVIVLTSIIQVDGLVVIMPGIATLFFFLSMFFTILSVNVLEIEKI